MLKIVNRKIMKLNNLKINFYHRLSILLRIRENLDKLKIKINSMLKILKNNS